MKKIMFLFTLLVFFTGCSIKDINNYEIDAVIEDAFEHTEYTANVVFDGYKYYLPRGINLVDKVDYNSKLLFNGNYYYLYIDVVSYYHKAKISYVVNKNAYFSSDISYNGNFGYIEIIEKNDGIYNLEIFYNYAKIETEVPLDNLKEAVYNSIKILSSVTYNDVILNTIIGDNILNYQEEEFKLFESKREEGNFLDYIEEFGTYDEEEENIKDEDLLESEEG